MRSDVSYDDPLDQEPSGLDPTKSGAELVAAERRRQVETEGWTVEHDARHPLDDLAAAARCYERYDGGDGVPQAWPWHPARFKPGGLVTDLVRAGALYLAEADRCDRIGLTRRAQTYREAADRCAARVDAARQRSTGPAAETGTATQTAAGRRPPPAAEPPAPAGAPDDRGVDLYRLRARYLSDPIPPCRVCGGPLTVREAGTDAAAMWTHDGSDCTASQWVERQLGDPEVVALVDTVRTLTDRGRLATAVREHHVRHGTVDADRLAVELTAAVWGAQTATR